MLPWNMTLKYCQRYVQGHGNPWVFSLIYNKTNSSCEFSPTIGRLPTIPSEEEPEIQFCYLGKIIFAFLTTQV